jgi:hypothetical protein
MQVLLNIPDKKAAFVMELLQNLTYVKAVPFSEQTHAKAKMQSGIAKVVKKEKPVKQQTEVEFLRGLRNAVQEAKDYEAGKIQLRLAREFLNEVRSNNKPHV